MNLCHFRLYIDFSFALQKTKYMWFICKSPKCLPFQKQLWMALWLCFREARAMMRCCSVHIFSCSSSNSSSCSFPWRPSRPRWSQTSKCRRDSFKEDEELMNTSSAYNVLGISPNNRSPSQLKAAFRAKVKEFHPDVRRNAQNSDAMIRRVIWAYQPSYKVVHTKHNYADEHDYADKHSSTLSNFSRTEIIERECLDPFDEPESEAFDVFVNEALCVGKGCPYSCVARAPHAFVFSPSTGTARVTFQGHGEDYNVQLAVGQCPRSCIHFVTSSQRIILEELLESILNVPYDTSAEADLLYSLLVKAKFENNRYQKPKIKPKVSSDPVDRY